CAVRLRNTINNTLWQMDFCKFRRYEYNPPNRSQGDLYGQGTYLWYGDQDGFCVPLKWDQAANYMDSDFMKIVTECGTPSRTVVDNSYLDIGWFVDKGSQPRGGRSLSRMVAAFKYIEQLLTPPDRRKPY